MLDIKTYCANLGSTNPAPGGGSASGISLSLGASCIEKAAKFSKNELTKLKNIDSIIQELSEIRKKGLELSKMDEEAFLNWQNARKLPKNNPDKLQQRQEKINYHLEEAIKVPLETCSYSLKLIETANDLVPLCNKYLISDLCIGALFTETAFESGLLNIEINLQYLKKKELLEEINIFKNTKINIFKKTTGSVIKICNEIIKSSIK